MQIIIELFENQHISHQIRLLPTSSMKTSKFRQISEAKRVFQKLDAPLKILATSGEVRRTALNSVNLPKFRKISNNSANFSVDQEEVVIFRLRLRGSENSLRVYQPLHDPI